MLPTSTYRQIVADHFDQNRRPVHQPGSCMDDPNGLEDKSFLKNDKKSDRQRIAYIMLAIRGKKFGFDKILTMIDDMVDLLKTEQQASGTEEESNGVGRDLQAAFRGAHRARRHHQDAQRWRCFGALEEDSPRLERQLHAVFWHSDGLFFLTWGCLGY